MPTYFLLDPFILLYWFYHIRRELIDIFSIIIYFPSTFCPTLGHHQERMYYKRDVTFVCTLPLYKKSIWAVAVVMYIQKLYHICNTSSPDDGPNRAESTLDINNYGKYINRFPAEYYKINTAIWKDQQENM